MPSLRSILTYVGYGLAALFGVIVLVQSWYTIDQGEVGVILRNGAVVGTAEPGLHFKIPVIDRVEEIDTRTRKAEHKGMQAYTRDAQTTTLTITVNYSVKPSAAVMIYSEYKSVEQAYERVISPVVNQQTKNIAGQFVATTLIADRTRFILEVNDAIKTKAAESGITIESIQLENIDFSDVFEKSVEQRMVAEVEVQKTKQRLENEKVEAEIVATKASAEANKRRQEADANAYSIEANAKAAAFAIESRGRAEAITIQEKGAALEKLGEQYRLLVQAEKWDGKLPQTMIPGATIPFIAVK